jgi:hypothetical protein
MFEDASSECLLLAVVRQLRLKAGGKNGYQIRRTCLASQSGKEVPNPADCRFAAPSLTVE